MGANPVELTDGTEAPGASDAPAPVAAAGGAIPLSNWLDALAEAMDELSDQALAWGAIERGEASTTLAEAKAAGDSAGAMIAIVGEANLQFALMSSEAGCAAMARGLLCMEADEALDDADMVDTVGEIINIVAGGIKLRMVEADSTLRLGLPVFIRGRIVIRPGTEQITQPVRLGEVDAELIVMRGAG